MKLIHLSDLHLGKRLNEFPMLEDQRYILLRILEVIDNEKPDAVMIAGDVYDKSQPSGEAIELFDDFLVRLVRRKLRVFVISGNHDSPERIAFGNRIMDAGGVYLSPVYNGTVRPVPLTDEYGTVNVFMLPFVRPSNVRAAFPDAEIDSYTSALKTAVDNMRILDGDRNVLLTHQFVTGAERSESEEISVGGTDNVDASVFDAFDYVALGHIHGPQNIGSDRIRYCGTPLKYSFSEVSHQKSVTVVELLQKGERIVRTVPLEPLHDLKEIRGTYAEVTDRSFYEGTDYPGSYLRVTLTDEDDVPEAFPGLRRIYPLLMTLKYDNQRTRHNSEMSGAADVKNKSPLEVFKEFFELRNGVPMTEEQTELVSQLIEKIWEGNR